MDLLYFQSDGWRQCLEEFFVGLARIADLDQIAARRDLIDLGQLLIGEPPVRKNKKVYFISGENVAVHIIGVLYPWIIGILYPHPLSEQRFVQHAIPVECQHQTPAICLEAVDHDRAYRYKHRPYTGLIKPPYKPSR